MLKKIDYSDYIIHDLKLDIWQFPLNSEFSTASSILSADESTRANRFHFDRHRRRFTIARAVLRLILARYLNTTPSAITFEYTKHGKPYIEGIHDIQFNLSHSGDLALLAIGKKFHVGIDLEFFSGRPYEGIGKQLFSPKELDDFSHVDPRLKSLIFFHIWAQKEAFIKASGLGLSYPTKEFDVPIYPPTKNLIFDKLHNKNWQMLSFMPEVACSAAICFDPLIEDLNYLNIKEIDKII